MVEQDLKTDKNGKKYTGMPTGAKHAWNYTNCQWYEQKLSADQWNIKMTSIKRRQTPTNHMGGIEPGTQFHWLIIADQIVRKIDENTYETALEGIKRKIGHKRSYWRGFSYTYKDQIEANKGQTQMKINALNDELKMLAEIRNREPTKEQKEKWANNKK